MEEKRKGIEDLTTVFLQCDITSQEKKKEEFFSD